MNSYQLSFINCTFDNMLLTTYQYIKGNSTTFINNTIAYSILQLTQLSNLLFQSNTLDAYSSVYEDYIDICTISNNIVEVALIGRSLMKSCIFQTTLYGGSLNFISNTQQQNNTIYHPRFLCLIVYNASSDIIITNNLISASFSTYNPLDQMVDLYIVAGNNLTAFTPLPNFDPDTEYYYEYEYAPNNNVLQYSNQLSRTYFLLVFNNQTVSTGVVSNNTYVENVQEPTLYNGFDNSITFASDSFIRMDGFSNIISLMVNNNTLNSNIALLPIRTRQLFTNTNTNALKTLFDITAPIRYQYIARAIDVMNKSPSNAFQNNIEIEPSFSVDEMRAWAHNLCHYVAQGSAEMTSCIVNNSTQTGFQEFSFVRDGACYGLIKSERIADILCPYNDVLVTGPYASDDAFVVTSANLLSSSPSITYKKRDVNSNVVIGLSPYAYVSNNYMNIVAAPLSNTTIFNSYHPIVLSTRYDLSIDINEVWQYRMSAVRFESLTFSFLPSNAFAQNTMFTTVRYDPTYTPEYLALNVTFYNCSLNPFMSTLDMLSLLSSSQTFSLLESDVDTALTIAYAFYSNFVSFKSTVNVFNIEAGFYNLIGRILHNLYASTLTPFRLVSVSSANFSYISNNWIKANASEFQLSSLYCYQCLVGASDGKSLALYGSFQDQNSYVRNVGFFSTLFTDYSASKYGLSFTQFSSIEISNYYSNLGGLGVGIYWNTVTNRPCTRLQLAETYIQNSAVHGNTYDVQCDPLALSCSGTQCILGSGLETSYCVVSPNVNTGGLYYNIRDFLTHADATRLCAATDGNGTRLIYVDTDPIYIESSFTFTRFNTSSTQYEKTIWTPIWTNSTIQALYSMSTFGQLPVVIYGNSMRFTGSTLMDYEFQHYRVVSPNDVSVTDTNSAPSLYLFGNSGTDTFGSITLTDVSMWAQVYYTPITLPSNTSTWAEFETSLVTLSQTSSVHPYIKRSNTVFLLNFASLSGSHTLTNVSLYGSIGIGASFSSASLSTSNNIASTLTNVVGENLFGAAFFYNGVTNTSWNNVHFDYFDGAYSPSYLLTNNVDLSHKVMSGISNSFDWSDVYLRSLVAPTNGTRLVSMGTQYPRQARISGVAGVTYTHVRMRRVFIGYEGGTRLSSVFPVGLEVTNSDRVAWALNDLYPPYWSDSLVLMRQIHLSLINSGWIGGNVFDIRSTDAPYDSVAYSANTYCNDACVPVNPSGSCRVGLSLSNTPSGVYPYSPVDFLYYDQAYNYCPYFTMSLIDNNVSTSDPSSRFVASIPNSRYSVYTSVFSTVCANGSGCYLNIGVGYEFDLSCIVSNTLNVPTGIVFTNIYFVLMNTTSMITGPLFEVVGIGSNCTYPTPPLIAISGGGFLVAPATDLISSVDQNTSTRTMTMFGCTNCFVSMFSVNNFAWNTGGIIGGVDDVVGYQLSPSPLLISDVFFIGAQTFTNTSLTFAPFLYINDPRVLYISQLSPSLLCSWDVIACVHLYNLSRLAAPPSIGGFSIVGVASALSTNYNDYGSGILLESPDTLSSLSYAASFYLSAIQNIQFNGYVPNYGGLSAPNIIDSFYPCVNGSCIYIQGLVTNNPTTYSQFYNTNISSPSWFFADYPSYVTLKQDTKPIYYNTSYSDCLYSSKLCAADSGIFQWYNAHMVEIIGALAILVFGPVMIWLFGCCGILNLFGRFAPIEYVQDNVVRFDPLGQYTPMNQEHDKYV